jgi:hypothetical protein
MPEHSPARWRPLNSIFGVQNTKVIGLKTGNCFCTDSAQLSH